MEDDEFYDLLYQLWARTTGAGDSYWRYDDESDCERVVITSVSLADETEIAGYVRMSDAEFITAVHGCIGDLIRKLRDLEDENSRLDELVDRGVADRIDLIKEIQQLEDDLGSINDKLDYV